jgi:hypothetical protein
MSESLTKEEPSRQEVLHHIEKGINSDAERLVSISTRIDVHGSDFIAYLNKFKQHSHQTAIAKGWWKEREQIEKLPGGVQQVQLALLMLIITELSEAAESIRHGCPPDDKVPEFSGLEAELGDAVIRILDMAEKYNLRLGEAIVAKMRCNLGRPALHGGKLA